MTRSAALQATAAFLLCFWVSVPGAAAGAQYSDHLLRTTDRTPLGLARIIPDLRGSSLIFIGEKHDEPGHHDLQLRILRALYNLGTKVAVGLEMFTARDQRYLDSWIQGTLSEKEFIRAHEKNWGDTWPLYSSIYTYAREKGIPLIGLNVPEEITTQVARLGFSSLSPEQRSQLPIVSCDVNEQYMSFVKRALAAHAPEDNAREFESFCEAQLVWDKTMAFRLVRHIKENPDVTVVVIAGNSHSWRPGIPEQLSLFSDAIDHRIILPEVVPMQTRNSVSREIADYLWLLQ